jgi:hypothetical protein
LAAPIATEHPTLNSACRACLDHWPSVLLIWSVLLLAPVLAIPVSALILLVGQSLASGVAAETGATMTAALSHLQSLFFCLSFGVVAMLLQALAVLHDASGERISVKAAWTALWRRPLRSLLGGLLFSLVMVAGFLLCVAPSLIIAVVMPIYVNRLLLTDQPLLTAFPASFAAVYGSDRGRDYALTACLIWLLVMVVSFCTCGLAGLVAIPAASFYLQNLASSCGVISRGSVIS